MYIKPMKVLLWLVPSGKFSKFMQPDTLKIHSLALSLDFFVKTFANYLSLPYKKLFFVDMVFKKFIYSNKNLLCMAINLWELGSDLSWNGAASCTEGITQSSVNYLHQRNQKVQNHYHKIKKSNICVIYYVSKRMKILS